MTRWLNILVVFALFGGRVVAQDILAGDIFLEHMTGDSFKAKVKLYTRTSANVNRDTMIIYWGDATIDTLVASEQVIGQDVSLYSYMGTHTYPGQGTYTVYVQDSFRIDSIENIPNSITTSFYLENVLVIDVINGYNTTPAFSWLPVDFTINNTLYQYNSGAIDADGDSLSYMLAPSSATGSYLPNDITVDSVTGTITWDKPQVMGKYAVLLGIREWRNAVNIGTTYREMLIDVKYPAGIDEQDRARKLQVYPNPAHSELYIKGNFDVPATIVLYDLTGRKVLSQHITSNQPINISALAKGLYVWQIGSERGKLILE